MEQQATITLKSGRKLTFTRSNRAIYRYSRCPEVGNGPQAGIAHIVNFAWAHCEEMGPTSSPEDFADIICEPEDWEKVGELPGKLGYLDDDAKKKQPKRTSRSASAK